MKCLALAALVAAIAFAAPARAQAHDFTITVPVNVSGLPSNITEMGVTCYVMPADYGDARNQIAFGGQRFRVSGAYTGNVTIALNAAPGKDPSLARFYRCVAFFYGTDRGVATMFFAGGTTTPPVFPLVAGAPFFLGPVARYVAIPGMH